MNSNDFGPIGRFWLLGDFCLGCTSRLTSSKPFSDILFYVSLSHRFHWSASVNWLSVPVNTELRVWLHFEERDILNFCMNIPSVYTDVCVKKVGKSDILGSLCKPCMVYVCYTRKSSTTGIYLCGNFTKNSRRALKTTRVVYVPGGTRILF